MGFVLDRYIDHDIYRCLQVEALTRELETLRAQVLYAVRTLCSNVALEQAKTSGHCCINGHAASGGSANSILVSFFPQQVQVVAPTAAAGATTGSNGKPTAGGEGPNGEADHIKRISAELDAAVKKERIARSSRADGCIACITRVVVKFMRRHLLTWFIFLPPPLCVV